jgi:hypothetical protein
VIINSPNAGTTVSSPVTAKVSANDNRGIRRLELWEGTVRVAFSDVTPPKTSVSKLALTWNASAGDHTLRARAIDTDNNFTWSAPVTFRVRAR